MKQYSLGMIGIAAALALAAGIAVDRVALPALAPGQNPNATGSSYATDAWKTYVSGFYDKQTGSYAGVSFSYPRDFDVREGENASGGFAGTPIVQVRFPEDAYQVPKSNFGEAYMTVSSGNDQKTVSSCFDFSSVQRATASVESRTVNGTLFKFATTTDVGAGNIYDSWVYRTEYKQRCYEFALTVHTGNIHNYPSGTVVQFDQSRAFSILDQIFETVKFTDTMR